MKNIEEFNWKKHQEKVIGKQVSNHGDIGTAIVNLDAQVSSNKVTIESLQGMLTEANTFILEVHRDFYTASKDHGSKPSPLPWIYAVNRIEDKMKKYCNEIAEFYAEDN